MQDHRTSEENDRGSQSSKMEMSSNKHKEFIIKKLQKNPSNTHVNAYKNGSINIYNVNGGPDTVNQIQ